jgi:hypothetical protein
MILSCRAPNAVPSNRWCWVTFGEQSRVISRERRSRSGSSATTRAGFLAAPADALPHRSIHNRMMPGKRSKGNLDPSLAIVFDEGGSGTPADDHDDRAALGALLVAAVGAPPLLAAGLLAALFAAVAMSAIAVSADKEDRVAALTKANPLPQNRFAMNRHASSRDWTTAVVSWQVRTSSVWFTCRMVCRTREPCRSNGRVPSISRL